MSEVDADTPHSIYTPRIYIKLCIKLQLWTALISLEYLPKEIKYKWEQTKRELSITSIAAVLRIFVANFLCNLAYCVLGSFKLRNIFNHCQHLRWSVTWIITGYYGWPTIFAHRKSCDGRKTFLLCAIEALARFTRWINMGNVY